MKNFLNKYGIIISLSLALILIFIFGGMYSRYMTNQIDVHEQERYEEKLLTIVDEGSSLEEFTSNGLETEFNKPNGTGTYQPELIDSFLVKDKDNNDIAIIYVVETYGNSEGLKVAFALSLEEDDIIDMMVIEHNETVSEPGQYYNKLIDENFFEQFENKDLDVIDFTVDGVSDATYSSKGFEAAMQYARELYAEDFDDYEIIEINIQVNSVDYNYDLTTINDYQFIANITFGKDNNEARVALDNDFNYLQTISGVEPTASEIEALPNYIADSGEVSNSLRVVSYDDTTNTIEVRVRGYNSAGIILGVELNSSLTDYNSIDIISTNENYDDPYNGGYDGAEAPAVEDEYLAEYTNNDVIMDSVAGATRTSEAMIDAFTWLDQLLVELNGGS
ncbi:MAG: FMN-binding protein [Candidatus Izemoplasmatales bacterium]